MNFEILTLFPDMFPGPLNFSIYKKALSNGLFTINATNIRDFSKTKSKTVDDNPYGGGAGMILRADILQDAFDHVKKKNDNKYHSVFLTPSGQKLTQSKVKEISKKKNLIIICGRYEGVDQRFLDNNSISEISVGDYILSGGKTAAFILIDACVRLIPEVLGNKKSLISESFDDFLLEYPHYTRPDEWKKMVIPEILKTGNHKKISDWRLKKSIEKTKKVRPELYKLFMMKNKGGK